ncbi:MAG: SRPBCC domain-containing protein [Rubrivivax sp.]|nr:SRPBCC domain-containing protein [Rubrivivax sp.]
MSAAALPGDQATVSVGLAVPPAEAFRVFTEEIDLWWRRGRRFRNAPGEAGIVCIEPGVGGRMFESFATDIGERCVETGRVLAWEPAQRLVFEWRAINFAPHERTEVEVRFEPTSRGGTRVTVVHRGWSALRADHPVRHGQDVGAFIRTMGLWWGDLMTSLRLRTAGQGPR